MYASPKGERSRGAMPQAGSRSARRAAEITTPPKSSSSPGFPLPSDVTNGASNAPPSPRRKRNSSPSRSASAASAALAMAATASGARRHEPEHRPRSPRDEMHHREGDREERVAEGATPAGA